ncbi:uncharacterized protein BBA_08557 [Beauveria bassiana ARSEF 2860]|uniref:Uncharacterized protein n=1 Tax=Beauveria bassiana (strain ARSEF 2860) TaxID=655819 RepID=J5J7U3_BEAB2|nr:uncharacterized protein BBA_08557 [Beauveria bassiana ARSEF 2860]EJP62473.1 hypothetical protein BBA_08557 [Beauveria bassiana ARSEF 2860]
MTEIVDAELLSRAKSLLDADGRRLANITQFSQAAVPVISCGALFVQAPVGFTGYGRCFLDSGFVQRRLRAYAQRLMTLTSACVLPQRLTRLINHYYEPQTAHLQMSSSNLPRREARQQSASIAQLQNNVRKVAELVRKLKLAKVPFFTREQLLTKYRIFVQKLDIATGEPGTQGQAYIEPVRPEIVLDWLKKYAPEKSADRPYFDLDFTGYDVTGMSLDFYLGEAMELCNLLLNHVNYSKDEKMGVMMGQESNWNRAELPRNLINSQSLPHSDWEARELFHQIHPTQEKLDFDCITDSHPAFPHLQCWLADELPVKDRPCLSPAELITTLALAVATIKDPKYHQASVIPITVFSCSGRMLRIVQGAINFRDLHLDFRCSPVIDFSVGALRSNGPNARKVAEVLGWVLGRPVGQTFPDRNE